MHVPACDASDFLKSAISGRALLPCLLGMLLQVTPSSVIDGLVILSFCPEFAISHTHCRTAHQAVSLLKSNLVEFTDGQLLDALQVLLLPDRQSSAIVHESWFHLLCCV